MPEQVTKEAIEQGRKVRLGDLESVKAIWMENSNGDPLIAVWWATAQPFPCVYSPRFLTLISEPKRREVWLNVYLDRSALWCKKEDAEHHAWKDRLGPAVYVPLISTDGGKTWGVDYEGRGRG